MTRHLNTAGFALIRRFEGCRLAAYRDPVGIWTIGYGHVGPEARVGARIRQDEAEKLLTADVEGTSVAVARLVPDTCSGNQFSALVCFAYNMGVGRLRGSALLGRLLEGDDQGCADQFPRWIYAAGRILPGLVARREAERALFLTPDTEAAS